MSELIQLQERIYSIAALAKLAPTPRANAILPWIESTYGVGVASRANFEPGHNAVSFFSTSDEHDRLCADLKAMNGGTAAYYTRELVRHDV